MEPRRLTPQDAEFPDLTVTMLPEEAALDSHGWRNWFLVTGMLLMVTTGLAAAILSLLRAQGPGVWPWPHSDALLLAALVIVELLFITYLTQQQRRVVRMRVTLDRLQRSTIERLERHYRRLDDILEVTRTTGTLSDPQAVFDVITRICSQTFRCDQVSLMLFDPKEGTLEVRSATGHEDMSRVLGVRQRLGDGIAGRVAQTREAVILGPYVDPGRFRNLPERLTALTAAMVVPILLRDELLGVLSTSSRVAGMAYDMTDIRALEVFAQNAAVTVRHTQTAEWMRDTIRRLDEALHEQVAASDTHPASGRPRGSTYDLEPKDRAVAAAA